MPKKTTIRDLAKATNLSITQVSKALNGYPDVSKSTKKLVIKTAGEMGYVPNKGARALASKKQTEITVLNLNAKKQVSENVFLILEGLYNEAEKNNLKVSVDFISLATAQNTSLSTYLIQNGITKPVIVGLSEGHPYYREVISNEFTRDCFILDNKIDKENIINVNVDDELGVKMVAYYFKREKLSNILVVGASFDSYVNTTRKTATSIYFKQFDINYVLVDGDYEYDTAQAVVLEQGDKIREFDGIFCFSDIMAVGANAALHELGITMPVVGFDGMEITDYVYPKISTVSQSFTEKGIEIVKVLTSETEEKHDIVVKPTFIKR